MATSGGKGRFWGADAGASSSEEEEDAAVGGAGEAVAAAAPAKFAAYASDSDSDDGGARVARSAKERVVDSLAVVIKALSHAQAHTNWVRLWGGGGGS